MLAVPGLHVVTKVQPGVIACLCCYVAFILQRRAEAYMAVQHYSAAAADLQKLVEQSGSSSEVAARLASAQVKQKLHGSVGPNHYLILGLEAGASSAEVKAAFK